MQIFANTDTGRVRSINQDAFCINTLSDGVSLAIVCDGMGGANAGDIASKTAVDIVSKYILNSYAPAMDTDQITRIMGNAIASANMEIYISSQKDAQYDGMGTTIVAAFVRGSEAVICSVGDSRAYLIGEDIVQITRDHSVVQTLVESGKLSPEEAKVHPEKNVITRALGVDNDVLVDSYCVELDSTDKILLCTDGLSNYVDKDDIMRIVNDNEPKDVANLLIEQANNGGGRDNITAAVISGFKKG